MGSPLAIVLHSRERREGEVELELELEQRAAAFGLVSASSSLGVFEAASVVAR